jgi:predicted nucleic acid-binding protein
MIAAYYDTAFLLKLYRDEPSSAAVRAHASTVNVITCSLHGRIEIVAAAHRKIREHVGTPAHLAALLDQLAADRLSGALQWLAVTDAHLGWIDRAFRRASADTYLRAGDALHLASAAEAGFQEIFSNDRHLLAAAPLFGLRGVDLTVS